MIKSVYRLWHISTLGLSINDFCAKVRSITKKYRSDIGLWSLNCDTMIRCPPSTTLPCSALSSVLLSYGWAQNDGYPDDQFCIFPWHWFPFFYSIAGELPVIYVYYCTICQKNWHHRVWNTAVTLTSFDELHLMNISNTWDTQNGP